MRQSLSSRKTKIVGTIGPASWDESQLSELIKAGLNVARLNFSHGDLARHQETFNNIRQASEKLQAPVGILQDLQGPKIRLDQYVEEMTVSSGDRLCLSDKGKSSGDRLVIDLENLPQFLSEDQSLFIDDGIIELKVHKIQGDEIHCEVIHGGIIRPRKGVNLPDADLPIKSLTDKDKEDLEKASSFGFDYVALSFVRSPGDIIDLKKRLKDLGSYARVIAKIEKKEAINNIKDIVEVSDGIMVARGDLSVEIGQVHLPAVQKKIIKLCNRQGKPVITATQMLDSMQVNSRPTRAEITDVANAVLDGSDALMLSGETAFGKYPVRAVQTMHNITCEVEKQPHLYHRFKNRRQEPLTIPQSIAISAVLCAKQMEAKTIVCLSTTGKTAQTISKYRPKARLIAVTAKSEALCKLELCWGVQTLSIAPYDNTEDAINKIENLLLQNGIVEPGEPVVLTMGVPVSKGQKTNAVRVFVAGKKSKKDTSGKKAIRFVEP
ncbi:MAG: pyruvate kinase [Pseudomonadota bacterium]